MNINCLHSLVSSASVLDRLNALVEPNGVLTISERGAIDGTVPSIEPHKNFRYASVFQDYVEVD